MRIATVFMEHRIGRHTRTWITGFALLVGTLLWALAPSAGAVTCARNLTAKVVVFDMPLMWNRLGAQNINGIMYALRRDTINLDSGQPLTAGGAAVAGRVALRPDNRPRPLVLRMAVGDCLTVTFQNLLTQVANPFNAPEARSDIPFNLDINNQVAERWAGMTATGVHLVRGMRDDGSFRVGQNTQTGAAPVGGFKTYKWYADKEGAFVIHNSAVTFGGEGQGGNTAGGMFGVLNVEPRGSTFYRSQLNREEMNLARSGRTADGHPIINYERRYPTREPFTSEGKAGLPVVNMLTAQGEIVHSDINAIIAYGPGFRMGPGGPAGKLGHFPASTYPLESVGRRNPTVPNRLEPFREFTVAFHDEVATKQAFPAWFEDPVLSHTLHGVRDSFMINYSSGGIGSEIIANRLGVGPMHDCINCAYEEFFLSFFTVGEVGQLVDVPANVGLEACDPNLNNCAANGPKANYVLYPDDPSNVHHSYTGDFTKFRNVHAGPGEQHIFHLHNHQWLWNANDDNSNYLDAQGLGPGSGYTYEINLGGSGNRNKTAGDAIFHCHFYPHFAQGMWEMWRIHDTFEEGTRLQAMRQDPITGRRASFVEDGLGLGDGTPRLNAQGKVVARALPDGEVVVGAPIPALVPLPDLAMAPMPGEVQLKDNPNTVAQLDPANPNIVIDPARPTGSLADVIDRSTNPGYPFWIAGMEHTVGQRATTPPLDMITPKQAQTLHNSVDPLWDHPGFADPQAIDGWDGGLPRFTLEGYSAGGGAHAATAQTRLDFSKEISQAKPVFYPERGTDLERLAMRTHAQRCHNSFRPDGSPASCTAPGPGGTGGFILNGAKPVPGAPYNEPCIDDNGVLLTEGTVGRFFSGESLSAMSVRGRSPHNATDPRVYKAANVQFDAVFNKLGYHFPQERIITLWEDVVPTIDQQRPPEPMVFRMNTFDCAQYVHSNVVPKAYELDDYQVRTPTDIIGQHIHLPKWDLTTADGAANGWNYEDGTLSPEIVVELIEAINAWNTDPANTPVLTRTDGLPVVSSDGNILGGGNLELRRSSHPFFGQTKYGPRWAGARSTMQRWYADPVVNTQGVDRGLGIIFTHDHYGPSTHQQVGLYATLLIEPAGSRWVHNETGVQLGDNPNGTNPAGRDDGGPTSWQAAILTGNRGFIGAYNQNVRAGRVRPHREFYLEFADFQHAYQPGVYVGANAQGFASAIYNATDANLDGLIDNPITRPGFGGATRNAFRDAIQPSVRLEAPNGPDGFPVDVWVFPPTCPGGRPRPCPEAISADDPGMYVVNYRNESLAARIYAPNRQCPDGKRGCQALGRKGDLAFALQSRTDRKIPELNTKLGKAPAGYAGTPGSPGGIFLPPITRLSALDPGDPFTPMMRAYDGDRVYIKAQTGATEEEHTAILHGLKWLQAGSGFGEAKNSGWRNAQAAGISEQFAFRTPVFSDLSQRTNLADYLYSTNASLDGWTSGTWGILRSYRNNRDDLFRLPANDTRRARAILNRLQFDDDDEEDEDGNILAQFKGVCPITAPKRRYDVTAVLANEVLRPAQQLANNTDIDTIVDPFPNSHMGRSPKQNRRSLVYNPRTTALVDALGAPAGQGPLHDPTALLYVLTDDLVPTGGVADTPANRRDPTVAVRLRAGAPIEPMVLHAAAGECIKVRLRNRLLRQAVDANGNRVYRLNNGRAVFTSNQAGPAPQADTDGNSVPDAPAVLPIVYDEMPELASANAIQAMVRRQRNGAQGMIPFNNNGMAPSAYVGLHPALVEYDVTRADGTNVGINPIKTVAPGRVRTYTWYAGHLALKFATIDDERRVTLEATPIEFGGFNIAPADKVKQGQKGLVGAGVILPKGATWQADAGTRTAATVTRANGSRFRDFTTVWQKGASLFYKDSQPVQNVAGEGDFGVSEDSQDMGHMAINYATEPLWFRFGLAPCDEGGACNNVDNARFAYSNRIPSVGADDPTTPQDERDPVTPVFTATAGQPFRMHVTMPFAPGRGSTYDLHGHTWQRDPYRCPASHLGLPGKCRMGGGLPYEGDVGSQELGFNPIGMGLGAIESVFAGQHYEIVIPSAGGAFAVAGDYLFRDHMGLGNVDGLWGLVRVR